MGYKPEGPNEYQGKQVIINSDRLLFNAKEDSIFLYSDKSISFSTNGTINFDIITDDKEHKGVFNIPYLYLGPIKDGELPNEPALLGNKAEDWLKDLLEMVEGVINTIESQLVVATPVGPSAPPGPFLVQSKADIVTLKQSIEDIKSTRINLL